MGKSEKQISTGSRGGKRSRNSQHKGGGEKRKKVPGISVRSKKEEGEGCEDGVKEKDN